MTEPRLRRCPTHATHIMCSVALAILTVVSSGCGRDDGTAEVHGTVTVDGTPAKTGAMTFTPIDGQSGTAGASITDGKYTARVPIGQCRVEVRVSKVVGESKMYPSADAPTKQILTEALPPKYNDQSELTLDVQPGVNEKNYEIQLN